MTRPAIPAELRRAVLVEAGHRCAIHTCKSEAGLDIHHIVPWSQCRIHEFENLITLCPNCHRRADQGYIDRTSLRNYKKLCQGLMAPAARVEINQALEAINHAPIDLPPGTWIRFSTRNPMEILMCRNISSITDTGYLDFGFVFDSDFPNCNYVFQVTGNGMVNYEVLAQTVGSATFRFRDPCPEFVHVEFF